jgi:HSP20 family molecular chaperone IbpA
MRYRRLSYRYAMVVRSGQTWPFGDIWASDRLRLLVQARWRPDADTYETATTIEMIVDLAGVEEDDFEVQLFEDAVVVDGHRRLPGGQEAAVYHAAGIRQGPFRVELPLPAAIDPERVQTRYDRGLLRVTLPKLRRPPDGGASR